ncbi:MAG TPA: hypothetical protein VJJ20_02800 [Candidatus Paceibacterota bacterium]
MFARTFCTFLVIAFSMLASLSANAQSKEEIDAYINSAKVETAAKFGVSEEAAATYLRTALSAVRAREAANKDNNEVSKLYADTLEQWAQTLILGEVVVARGQALLVEMKDGVPGTPVPQPLVKKINAWASFAGETLVIGARASGTAGKWAEQRFLQSGVCNVKSKDLNFTACEKIAKETVDMYGKIMDHFAAMAKAVNVLVLTVPRMTY